MKKKTKARWRRPWADWWMLGRALWWTVCIRGALSWWSLRDVNRMMRRIAETLPRRGTADEAYRRRAAWAANAVGHRLLPRRPCLTQALVLQYLLLRRGDRSAELRIGVTKGEDDRLLAHAWIERDGRVLIGGTASPWTYKQFPGLDAHIGADSSDDA